MQTLQNRNVRERDSAQAAVAWRWLGLAATLFSSACEAESEAVLDGSSDEGSEGDATTDTTKEPPFSDDVSVSRPVLAGARYCTKNNDCQDTCMCSQNLCVPDGWGPPPPQYLCDQPPVRLCSSNADCKASCFCTAGYCKPSAFGPLPPSDLACHMPPPDSYENDDIWQSWKPYVGSPQSHNFHHASDADWVAVYFGSAGSVQFRTQDLSYGTDTVLEIYSAANGGKGPLVASHDNVGGEFWVADSKSSRVDLVIPAKSSYFVRVVNKSPASIYAESYEFPAYTLKIAYK